MTVAEQVPQRFAIYCRYSDEIQNEVTLESQEAMCQAEVKRRNGVVVSVYQDAAQMGWSLDREGFSQLRADAEQQLFDAIIMWKFDRLARGYIEVTMLKALFRHEYGVKLYCVEGFSEDDDNSPHSAMMERMLAVFSDFYSKNLSTEVKRANRHRHANGKFNGGRPPFGYVLATEKIPKRVTCFQATVDKPPGLYIDPIPAELVRYAFQLYASGEYSYRTTALALTEKAQELNYSLDKPFHPQMIRDLLQNKIYCGYVSYVETIYRKGFGRGKASARGRRQWTEGIHEPIISEALFEKVQAVRNTHKPIVEKPRIERNSLLAELLFCAKCLQTDNHSSNKPNYGKMYTRVLEQKLLYYECSSIRHGYGNCGQTRVRQEIIHQQVIDVLSNIHLHLSDNVLEQLEIILQQQSKTILIEKRLDEIKEVVEQLDFSWENSFIDEESYMQKQNQLRIDIETLQSAENNHPLASDNILRNFDILWEQCITQIERQEFIRQFVERVIIEDDQVTQIEFKGGIIILL